MQLKTALFGDINVLDEEIILFSTGIPGFSDYKQYVILHPDPELPVSYLQSLEEGSLSFVMVDPFAFYPQYEFKISETDLAALEIEQTKDVAVYCIVTIKDSLHKATVNLVAPIVINISRRIGKQIVLQGTDYGTKHPLVSQVQSPSEEGKSCSY